MNVQEARQNIADFIDELDASYEKELSNIIVQINHRIRMHSVRGYNYLTMPNDYLSIENYSAYKQDIAKHFEKQGFLVSAYKASCIIRWRKATWFERYVMRFISNKPFYKY